jgi:hypothetical protein
LYFATDGAMMATLIHAYFDAIVLEQEHERGSECEEHNQRRRGLARDISS